MAPFSHARSKRRRFRFGWPQRGVVRGSDLPAGAGDEDPLPGCSNDGDRAFVHETMVMPAQQDPEIHVGGTVVFEPLLAVMDLPEAGRCVAAGVLAVFVAGDDRPHLVGGEDPLLPAR